MRVFEFIELRLHRRHDVGMRVAQAGHRRAARRVNTFFSARIADENALAHRDDGILKSELPMKHVRHDFARDFLEGKMYVPKADNCSSLCTSAFSVSRPRRAAISAAKHSMAAKAGVIEWKNDGVSVSTMRISSAKGASGDNSLSVTATIRAPFSFA